MPGDFFDSNVLLYVASPRDSRADRAERIVSRGGAISVQVLSEVTHVARRKFAMDWLEIDQFLTGMRAFVNVHDLTFMTHAEAMRLARTFRLAWYDALIVAAALLAGCDRLLTEDMHHGLVIDDSLRIENPFLA
ncbi:MAG: PIN domain-containing protein [Sphingomonas sp.]